MAGSWAPVAEIAVGGAAGGSESPWIGVVVGSIVVLTGSLVATDFMRAASRMHSMMSRRAPETRKGSFTRSFEYQRMMGVIVLCGGLVTVALSVVQVI